MKKDLKKIIRTELNEKYEVDKAFNYLMLCENDNDKFYLFVNYLDKVISEKKTPQRITTTIAEHYSSAKSIINEQEQAATGVNGNFITDFFGKMFNAAKEQGQNAADGDGFFGTTAGEGILSQAFEWIIEKVLNVVGFTGDLAKILSTILSEVKPVDFITIFKDPANCPAAMANISTAVAEGFVRHIADTNLKKGHRIADTVRNYLFEIIEKQEFSQKIGAALCKGLSFIRNKIPLLLSRFQN